MDEFREEREKVKNGTWKQKLAYFWEYYNTIILVKRFVFNENLSIFI